MGSTDSIGPQVLPFLTSWPSESHLQHLCESAWIQEAPFALPWWDLHTLNPLSNSVGGASFWALWGSGSRES